VIKVVNSLIKTPILRLKFMHKKLLLLSTLILIFLNVSAQKKKFDVQGKAGARGIMPENTIEGMLKALDLGVTTLEMDAVISKDKQVVLSQEPYFNNEISLQPNGKAITLKDQKNFNIYKMDYDEIKKFDVGSKVHSRFPGQMKFKAYKPLLSETIDAVEAYVKAHKMAKPVYSIETKTIKKGDNEFHPEPAEFVDLIMSVINEKKLAKRVIIESFDMRTLQYLHEKYPKTQTSLLIDEKEPFEDYIEKLGFKPTIYSPYSVLVGKGLVDRCHEMGIKIIPWTVNTVKDVKYFMSLGVDGIITDFPNIMGQLE
jgi:glycerophosphoryl diester phosphodiesterase